VKYFNARTGLLVLRCGRGEHATVWASLTLLSQLRGRAAMMRLLHLAGATRALLCAALMRLPAALGAAC
jgi:RNase P/RNase MRP subunit POP5